MDTIDLVYAWTVFLLGAGLVLFVGIAIGKRIEYLRQQVVIERLQRALHVVVQRGEWMKEELSQVEYKEV